jgi:hypothetical protein
MKSTGGCRQAGDQDQAQGCNKCMALHAEQRYGISGESIRETGRKSMRNPAHRHVASLLLRPQTWTEVFLAEASAYRVGDSLVLV